MPLYGFNIIFDGLTDCFVRIKIKLKSMQLPEDRSGVFDAPYTPILCMIPHPKNGSGKMAHGLSIVASQLQTDFITI